jgi:hypothetical protein
VSEGLPVLTGYVVSLTHCISVGVQETVLISDTRVLGSHTSHV